MADEIDQVIDKLAKDVETTVHAMYRGEVRQHTVQVRTVNLVRDAVAALRARSAGGPASGDPAAGNPAAGGPGAGAESQRTPATSPSVAGAAVGWTREEGEAVMKCVTAWLPMGSPRSAPVDSKCIASGREMVPSWGERERARAALRKLTPE